MIPNCRGCECEYQEAIIWLERGYDVAFEGLGERKHLLIAVFDNKGEVVLW